MHGIWEVIQSLRGGKSAGPSEELRVAVTFPRTDGGPGPTKPGVRLSLENVKDFVPEAQKMDQGIKALEELGFSLTERGRLTVSMKCTRKSFQKAFKTELKEIQLDPKENYAIHSIYYPPKGAPWKIPPTLTELIDDVYIQWPHMHMAGKKSTSSWKKVTSKSSAVGGQAIPSVKPPKVNYFHLEVPDDVASYLNATRVHKEGTKGKGIRVVMVDTGFELESHPFFAYHGYKSKKVVLAGDAKDKKKDFLGHGTGESANIFALAPRVEFIGVKIGTDDPMDILDINPASMLEGFQIASQQNPDIISFSGGNDLRYKTSQKQRSTLPNSLKALEAEILYAIASGITVVASAGNGAFSFPAMMPDVIAAGGVFRDKIRKIMQASNEASAYDSKIYPGRHVPDVCGLVGMGMNDRYIMLPVPPDSIADCLMDSARKYKPGGTPTNDGWQAFSGTSAAAPQIAGVCALLRERNPNLKPSEIKAILRDTAMKVLKGKSNPKSSDDRKTPQQGPGATGAGLVDAFKAWKEV